MDNEKTKKIIKTLAIIASVLTVVGVGVSIYENREKTQSSSSPAKVQAANNAPSFLEKTKKSLKKIFEKKDAAREETSDFETAIQKYDSKTQDAMRMSIDWLKKYNEFTKARAQKDNIGLMAARMEMDAYEKGIQHLNARVWDVINNKIGPDFVKLDKEKPGVDFDLSDVYKRLIPIYDTTLQTSNGKHVVQENRDCFQRKVSTMSGGRL